MKKIIRVFTAAMLAACMLTGCAGQTESSAPESISSEVVSENSSSTTESVPEATTTATTTEPAPEATTTATTAEPAPEVTTTATTTEPVPKVTITATTTESAPEATTTATTTEPVPETTTTATTANPVESEPEVTEEKLIALTFDDGPNTTTTHEMLDVLEKHGVVASFFLIGNNINDQSAEAVKRAYDMGCEIGNHSKSHEYMDKLTPEEIIAEFEYVQEKVKEITGEEPKFFRPPYFAVADNVWDNIDIPFIAGVGCNDWDPKVPADRRAKVILRSVKDGSIILMHDAQGNSATVEAVDMLIPELKAQGYRFVTVSELFDEREIEPKHKILYSNVDQLYMWG